MNRGDVSDLILCFPPGGSGPSFYKDWADSVQTSRIVAIEAPGKERRIREPLPDSTTDLVEAILPQVLGAIDDANHVVFFGHSFGAVVAFEALLASERTLGDKTATLVVSGCPRPGTPRANPIAHLNGDAFLEAFAELAGERPAAFDVAPLIAALLPAIRSDTALHEGYRPTSRAVVSDIVGVRGREDRLVTRESVFGWAAQTTGAFAYFEFDGPHMYLAGRNRELVAYLASLEHGDVPGRQ